MILNHTLPLYAPIALRETAAPVADVRDIGSVSLLDDASSAKKPMFSVAAADVPLVITRLSPSCHCASAVLSGAGNANVPANLPFSLAPNTPVTVTVSIALSELRPGAFTKSVIVYAKSSPDGAEFVLARDRKSVV